VNAPFPQLFECYADAIAGLPERQRLFKTDLLVEQFRVFKSEDVEIYYAPLDFVNVEAKIAIVGITPGWTQMEIAFRRASAILRDGGTSVEALRRAKEEASFAGAMRNNLVKMLDEIGLQRAMRLNSCRDLFGSDSHLVHTTSAVRHPTFIHGRNYSGHSPDLLSHPLLSRYIKVVLAAELTILRKALIIPLGKCVDAVFRRLIQTGALSAKRCLLGFPHPSGANGHRRTEFEQRRDEFVRVVEEWASPT
jgi:hypothetical protein